MRILVTGGAGFIGSHLCERLILDGHELSILDDLNDFYSPAAKILNLERLLETGSTPFYEGDITNEPFVRRVFQESRPEAVVHLAARAGVRPSLEQPLLYERTNVYGTLVLLECSRNLGVRKFVFASSSSIYGVANQVPFSETDHLNLPISPYAATKIAGEKLCYTYSHLYRLSTVCLRFFTVYGPRQRPDLAIRKFTERISSGQPIQLYGDGSSGRDYTFVKDIVEGIVSAIDYPCAYEVFNLGNASPVQLIELLHIIEKCLGKTAHLEWLPIQPGDVPITYADISKAQGLLKYSPKTALEEGIKSFVEWYTESGMNAERILVQR